MNPPVDLTASRVFLSGMNAISSRPLPARPLTLPNILTYARVAAVPVVAGLMFWQSIFDGPLWLRWVALTIFISASVTDILDGYLDRTWIQQSSLGRMLDPIADKLLVASCLLMLAAEETSVGGACSPGWSFSIAKYSVGFARVSCRASCRVPVTRLAKWKTGAVVAVGLLIAGEAGDRVLGPLPR